MSHAHDPALDVIHEEHGEHHVLPLWIYLAVYGALLALTFVTVGVSYLDLGTTAIVAALTVAIVKASLVAGYFMHLRYDDRFNSLIFVASILFMVLFFSFVFIDLTSRGLINPVEDNFVLRKDQGKTEQQLKATKPAAERGEAAPP
ncbi:MAG: cytochrome C oxidase subunit IV family protein [Deltaproteobacteria bacterium]|nr:cytochrome C oxidase subunit IV family protein [Deltaproteobacteria bacterium]